MQNTEQKSNRPNFYATKAGGVKVNMEGFFARPKVKKQIEEFAKMDIVGKKLKLVKSRK